MNDDIKVTGIVDHEDGSATVTLNMDAATYHKVFEYGLPKTYHEGDGYRCINEYAITLSLHTTQIH
jgi:hypothetical protein